MRFNPFARVVSRYGAPMGRAGCSLDSYDGSSKLYARHCGGDGYYDRGGAYWGHSSVCAVWTRGGAWCAYVETREPWRAIEVVQGATRGKYLRDGFKNPLNPNDTFNKMRA